MSEKIYAFLLRFYPAWFRAKYGDAAMELFRDRARDERGFLRQLRLWLDFLKDLTISLPRTYNKGLVLTRAPVQGLQEIPSFPLLTAGGPRGTSIVLATMFSLVMFVSLLVWIAHGPKLLGEPWTLTARPASHAYLSSSARVPTASMSKSGKAGAAASMKTKFTMTSTAADFSHSSATRLVPFASGGSVRPQAARPDVEDATQAMIQAIRTHEIVMLGEIHGNRQEYEWLCKLVKTPGFADRVDDIVVEFGNSLYQKSVDRYIAGDNVPFAQVQKAWRNVIGAVGPVSPVYGWFYKAVRESNLERPGGHKIRLLLGDPYGDWENIKNAEDLGPYLGHRDQWYAQVVKDEVLARHHHALLIMGAGHFLRRNGPGEVERAIRSAGVQPYLVVFGTNAVGGYDDLDPRFNGWQAPVIVPLSGNWMGDLPAMPVINGGEIAPNSLKMKDVADAMLYLGRRDSLTAVNVPRSELVGTGYGKEVARRFMIQTGQTLEFTRESEVPQFPRPLHQVVSNGVHLLPPHPPKSAFDPLPPRPPAQ